MLPERPAAPRAAGRFSVISIPAQALMSWSGDEDAALALHYARRRADLAVTHLLASVNAHYERVSMHDVRLALLESQAERIGLPLTQPRLPEMPSMADYDEAQQASLRGLHQQNVRRVIYGDIFRADLRGCRCMANFHCSSAIVWRC